MNSEVVEELTGSADRIRVDKDAMGETGDLQAEQEGVLTEVVNELDSSIPILEEPQANQNSQEIVPKKENSTEDKLRQLNDLKEKSED